MLQHTTHTQVIQPSPMTAGTPIILAPRIQTPQLAATMTSLSNQSVLAAGGHTPSVVAPANPATVPTSNLLYSYDPTYLQRMLEYSTTVDPSAVGKCLTVFFLFFFATYLLIRTSLKNPTRTRYKNRRMSSPFCCRSLITISCEVKKL